MVQDSDKTLKVLVNLANMCELQASGALQRGKGSAAQEGLPGALVC